MPYICQFVHVQASDNYNNRHALYELSAIKNVTRKPGIHTRHYWHMSLNKYAYHSTHTCCTALVLYFIYRFKLVHNTQNKKENATLIHPTIAMYVPKTNMPLK